MLAPILRAAAFIPRVILGTGSGAFLGLTRQAAIRGVGYSAEFAATQAATARFFTAGLDDIARSGLRTALSSSTPYRSAFTTIVNRVGPKGLALLALLGGAGFIAVAMGIPLVFDSFTKFSRLKNQLGSVVDECREPWVHGALAASGLALGVGGLLIFTPAAPLGMSLALGGLIATVGLKLYKYVVYGTHMFRYPEMAPYPISAGIRLLKNWHY